MSNMRRIASVLITLAACHLALAATAAEAPADRVAVGQEAPEISLPGLGDETHVLSSLRGEKNTILVFYRGGW